MDSLHNACRYLNFELGEFDLNEDDEGNTILDYN